MKKLLRILTFLLVTLPLFGQTNSRVRLGLVAESGEAAAAVDLLTAQLSGNNGIQLLERDEIEKVYHEQSTSAANRDDIKLGRILGADGLLLLQVTTLPHAADLQMGGPPPENLTIRLIAVKPGVILADGNFPWPVTNAAPWAQSVSTYLNSFLTKLTVSAKDAIPISVVNLHSAIQSADALDTEHQLKLLAIQRLSQEPQFFVLERQKMQLLGEEKNLKSDETPFWDGSYLLDGTVDQNGYSKDTITIDARLTPSKGGAPLSFEVSGSRTNLAEVINSLALKVAELLKVNPAIKQWDAAGEASRYYDEANWALKWRIFPEAEADADSAWTLGKQDLGCALVRVRAYASQVPDVEDINVEHYSTNPKMILNYVHINDTPNAEDIDHALQALEIYYKFSRTSPDGEPGILTRGPGWNDWHDSDWYLLGIDALTAASQVLQHYYFNPQSQLAVADQLADLRKLARSTASLISQSPSIHDGYFVGDRIAPRDELSPTMEENPSIFRCEVNWACFWQERPEDTLSLYRELMSSPVFCYIHSDFWNRTRIQPRLVEWDDEDQKNIPSIWKNFVGELDSSTNVLWQMEAKALEHTDATNDNEAKADEAAWWSIVHSHREELVGNNVELFYLGWGFAHNQETEAMDEEYWQQTIPARKTATAFEEQKNYLANFTPYDFPTFTKVFSDKNYTQAQAAELKPLIVAYESNLVANATGQKLFFARANAQWIGMILEKPIDQILNPPAQPQTQLAVQPPNPAPIIKKDVVSAETNAPEVITNVILVNKSFTIPIEQIITLDNSERIDPSSHVTVRAHHWFGEKLLLDFDYDVYIDVLDNGHTVNILEQSGAGIAILDPATANWQVIGCPPVDITKQNNFYNRTVLLNGNLFNSDGGQIRKYDFTSQQWQVLKISDGNNYELFAVNGRLYAANQDSIFEITDDGASTRILASTRRQPAVSVLDSQDLGTPVLFAGPGQSLRASVGSKIFVLAGDDWREDSTLPSSSFPPEILEDGALFRHDADGEQPMSISFLPRDANRATLYLQQKVQRNNVITSPFSQPTKPPEAEKPLWQLPANMFLAKLPATVRKDNLFVLLDHSQSQDVYGKSGWGAGVLIGQKILPQNGYHAELLNYSPDLPQPGKIFLKFEDGEVMPPLTAADSKAVPWFPLLPSTWMSCSSNALFFGLEAPRFVVPFGQPSHTDDGGKVSIWQLPISELESAMAAQKQGQLAELAREKSAQEKSISKYDRNHNGVIDPGEKEEALDDPAFIGSELDKIDANHDGWLEAGELAYFDANHNQILDPKEQAGIDIAQHLLATRLMNKYDADGKGYLTPAEFNDLRRSCTPYNPALSSIPMYPGPNRNQNVDLQHVEDYLKSLTRRSLRLPGMAQAISPNMTVPENSNAQEFYKARQEQTFKLEVEYYWKNSGVHTN